MTEPRSTFEPAPPAGGGPPARRARGRRTLVALVGLAAGALLAWIVLRQSGVATALVNTLLARVTPVPRATVHVDRVHGDWVGWLELDGLRVTRGDTLLARVDTLRARYSLAALVVGRVDVGELTIHGVLATDDLRDTTKRDVRPKPALTFEQILQGRFYTGWPLRIDRASLSDAVIGGRALAPDSGFRIMRLHAGAHGIRLGRGFAFQLDSLGASLVP